MKMLLIPIYTLQKLSRSGSRKCPRLNGTFLVQYNKAHHNVVYCSDIVKEIKSPPDVLVVFLTASEV